MSSIFLIQSHQAFSDSPTNHVRHTSVSYASTKTSMEKIVKDYVKDARSTSLCIVVEEYKEGYNYDNYISKRIFDMTGNLIGGYNFETGEQYGESAFQKGEIVLFHAYEFTRIGIIVSIRQNHYSRYLCVDENGECFDSFAVFKPKFISVQKYKKLQKQLNIFLKEQEEEDFENTYKEIFFSHCHIYKGENKMPENFSDNLEENIWIAEKAMSSYPPIILAKSNQERHDIEILLYFVRWGQQQFVKLFLNKYPSKKLKDSLKKKYDDVFSFLDEQDL